MGDMLNTAVSGLLSYQRALSTTSHNISNVNTDGYSRQTVGFETRNPTAFGDNFVGSGVQISNISRAFNQYINSSIRDSQSMYSKQEMFHSLSAQIDDILADPKGGISPILQEFFTATQDVADDPSSSSARSQMINTANSLVNRFQTFNTRFDELSRNVNDGISDAIDEVNTLVSAIQEVNISLARLNVGGEISSQSSDLLDRRDALLNTLSQKIDIQVINEQENNITVMVGNGQTLLNGSRAFQLATRPDPGDPSREIIVYQGFNSGNDISAQLTGGEIGGMIDYRNNVLNPTRNSLGRVALVFAETFNQQHNNGMDLNGALGGDFFSVSAPTVTPFTSNTGISGVNARIIDLNQLTTNDYELSFNGTAWQVTSSDGTTSALATPVVAVTTTINFDGIQFDISSTSVPNTGDAFTIRPTFSGARTLDVVVSDPNQIAAASPIRTLSSDANLGDATISPGFATDPNNVNLLSPVTLTFATSLVTPPDTVLISDSIVIVGPTTYAAGAEIPYTKGMQINSNGWQANLTGTPQVGDTFSIESNTGGVGDNRNMLSLAQLQTTDIFDGNTANYQEAYSIIVGSVGSLTSSSEIDRDANEALLIQYEDRRGQVSGVNLDEEAANLIKYQQAYEATARVIATAQTIFDTLLNAFR